LGVYDELDSVQDVAAIASSSERRFAYVLAEDRESEILSVIDVTDPARPVEIGWCETLGEAKSVDLARGPSGQIHAYVANGGGGLTIFRLRYSLVLPLLLRSSP
jgi:hypothetical protein